MTDEVITLQPMKFHLLSDALLTTKKTGGMGGPSSTHGGVPAVEETIEFYSFIPLEDVQTIEEDNTHPTTVRITLCSESRKLLTVKYTSVHKKKVPSYFASFPASLTQHFSGMAGLFCRGDKCVQGKASLTRNV